MEMASIREAFRPILLVIGATGTGKSKLALEMACRFNGEIISADSMQVYKGLDIITNKVTLAERVMCPHHLIDFVSPFCSDYTVTQFRNAALAIIDDIHARKKLPVIVGGTNYYIESILWKFLIDSITPEAKINVSDFDADEPLVEHQPVKQMANRYNERSTEDLLRELKSIDAESAQKIHPKDRRKIVRALEVYHQTGVTRSEHLVTQHTDTGPAAVSGSLLYRDTCMIWVQCDQTVLDSRVDKRVDEMIANGLVQELLNFHDQYNKDRTADRKAADYTLGIFQSIGFKEFHEYLQSSEVVKKSEEGKQLFERAVDDVKRATRQYARRQIKWIKNRFIRRRAAEVPPVYTVDSTDPALWDDVVKQRTEHIIACFLEGRKCDIDPIQSEVNMNESLYNHCQHCNLVCVTKSDWLAHINGRRHKKKVEGLKKLEKYRAERLKHSIEASEVLGGDPLESSITSSANT